MQKYSAKLSINLAGALLLAISFPTLVLTGETRGAEIRVPAPAVIFLSGKITQSDVQMLEQHLPKSSNFLTSRNVHVNSSGGDWDAAMKIGRLLRGNLAHVAVHDGNKCLSACVLLLAGAAKRVIFPKAQVGIHRPYSSSTASISIDEAQRDYRKLELSTRAFLHEMNLPVSLFEAMVNVPPEKMRLLSSRELAEFRLDQTDPVVGEVEDASEARRWGLSKQVFLARKAQASQTCNRLLPRFDQSSGQAQSIDNFYACRDAIMAGKR